MVDRAFDKPRQAARGMPAVMIRMMDALSSIAEATTSAEQRRILVRQAEMIFRSSEESVSEPNDREVLRTRYVRMLGKAGLGGNGEAPEAGSP